MAARTPAKPKPRKARAPKDPSGQRLADGRPVTTASTFSPRLHALRADLEEHLRRLFPNVEAITAYNMHGWRIRRPIDITQWPGTLDPNWIHLFVAERKQGITLHVWNPYEHDGLKRRAKALEAAGLKVMVGCLQFNRKGEFPLAAVVLLLESMAKRMEDERLRSK